MSPSPVPQQRDDVVAVRGQHGRQVRRGLLHQRAPPQQARAKGLQQVSTTNERIFEISYRVTHQDGKTSR